MDAPAVFKTKLFNVFVIVFIVACLIKIFSNGYRFGQWLYSWTRA